MFYRINDSIRLCGWDQLECALRDLASHRVYFMRPEQYQLLSLCTGKLDSGCLLFNDEQRALLEQMQKAGIMMASDEPLPPIREEQKYHRYHNRFIRSAQWSITGRCNYRCRHCYMSAPEGKYGQLTREECEHIVRELADCGVMSVALTGGEALVHPDFWYIVDLLLAENMEISTVYSNGALINEDFFAGCES